jgi:flagellar motor component MotA
LEETIDNEKFRQRDIMEYGIRLAVDGTNPSTINRILANIINQETNEDLKKLKIIQKDAIFAIQEGWHPRLLIMLLNSHVDIGIDQVMQEH